jgi:peptidoglycan glycosyltransferase
MQTSLARRQRRRRYGNGRRQGGGGRTVRGVIIAIPLFLFSTFVLLGLVGLVSAVVAYNQFATGLPDPLEALQKIRFEQQTVVYDRTGTVELARFGGSKRELVTFEEIPAELIDATTAVEDKTFWENVGFDPVGIVSAALDTLRGNERGASTITQQLVRQRLLPREVLEGSRFERKIKEIIQSVRLTQGLPEGEAGKKAIITAYLNQNFYGNQSYGVKAAARSYFAKDLSELTLAEAAVLAGIPQSPTRFDLVKNAVEECEIDVLEGEDCPAGKTRLVVPADSEIVQRRNYILGLMKTRSVLSGKDHTLEEYDLAMTEPLILARQVSPPWKAPHLVWQVRSQLGAILCSEEQADNCPAVDTGGYKVITTIDWKMQQTVDKWLYAGARIPNAKDPQAVLTARKVPKAAWKWILGLKGRNINNAAGAVIDARTGQVLAYGGSAGYYEKGNKKFQPQFDVLADGWRQPGSSIKPVNYAVGIDDRTLTAASLLLDVVADFNTDPNQKPFTPTQADGLERGPVRLRSALQFSLNIPAIKAGLLMNLDRLFQRSKDFGLSYFAGTVPVISMSIGTLVVHPIDLLGAYGALANGGLLMPRTVMLEVSDQAGNRVWPATDARPAGKQVVTRGTAFIMTDMLAGNTDDRVNRYWAEWKILEKDERRPAAYKTGTTSDNKDVHAYGYLAPPEDPAAPLLTVGVWMGNSDATQNKGSLSLDSSAPLWSAILTEISRGLPVAEFAKADDIELDHVVIDAHSGFLPGPFTTKTMFEWFLPGTAPTRSDDTKVAFDLDSSSGLLWQDGCAGPVVTQGFLDPARLEAIDARFPNWQTYDRDWLARAAQGPGVAGGPENTRTTYFYNGAYTPFSKTWGAPFPPTELCTPLPSPSPEPLPSCDPFFELCPSPPPSCDPFFELCPSPPPSIEPSPEPFPPGPPSKPPKP